MNNRLRRCKDTVLVSLDEIRRGLEIYGKTDNEEYKQFFVDFLRFHIIAILEDYKAIVQILYKSKSKAVTADETFLRSIEFCIKEGMIPDCDLEVFNNLEVYKDKQSDVKGLLTFCRNIDGLREITNGIKEYDDLKKSNSFYK